MKKTTDFDTTEERIRELIPRLKELNFGCKIIGKYDLKEKTIIGHRKIKTVDRFIVLEGRNYFEYRDIEKIIGT